MRTLDLTTLQHGAVIDMFNEEFQKVLCNIADDNVKADATREITIKVSIKPDKTRQTAATKIDVTSRLAPVKSADGMMFIGRDGANLVAYEDNCEQLELTDSSSATIFEMPAIAQGGK